MICRHCNGKEVESIITAFTYTVYGCLTCGLIWLARRIPFKTKPPGSR
jgi:uncharacterized Zn finger protein